MFSNNDNYDLDSAKNKLDQAKEILNIKIEIKMLEQVLIAKGVMSKFDLDAAKKYVVSDPNIQEYMLQIAAIEDKIKMYKNNPEQHLRDLFNAKMNGTIK